MIVGEKQDALINPLLTLRTEFIPASLTLAASAVVTGYDDKQNHKLEVFICRTEPTADTIDEIKKLQTTGIQNVAAPLPEDNLRINWSVRNAPFEDDGKYYICCNFDTTLKAQPFYIHANQKLVKANPEA